jgi:calmodulin
MNTADKDIKEVFAVFDRNGDGKISAKELATAMRLLKRNPTNAEIVVWTWGR